MVNSVPFEINNKILFWKVLGYKLTDAVQAAKNGQIVILMTFLYRFRVEEFIPSATD